MQPTRDRHPLGVTRRSGLLLLALLLAALGRPAAGQDRPQPPVQAMLGSGIVRLGQTTRISVEVQNADRAELLELPEVDGLRIGPVGPPRESTFTRIYGGRSIRRVTLSWDVPLTPERQGEFAIPPLVLKVDGKIVQTQEFALRVVIDTRGEELGFIELVNPPTRIYEGQPFTLDLRFGWDQQFTVNSVDLRLPWWGQLPGTLELDTLDTRSGRPEVEVGLNSRYKVRAEQLDPIERDGRSFNQFRVARRYLASRTGTLELPVSSFEFARLLRRGGFGSRDEYEEFFVRLESHMIEVLPVPEEGQPPSWTGAVGSINASRRVDRRDVDAGDSIKLTVAWSGSGNLEFFDAPDPGRMDSFSGFRLLGTQDRHASGVRQVTYDLVPISSEIDEVPPLPLWTFDPELDAYREVRTEPVSIRVRRLEGAMGLEEEEAAPRSSLDIEDIRPQIVEEDTSLPRPGPGRLALALPLLLAGWVITRRSVRRRADPAAPVERARRRARGVLVRQLGRAGGPSDQQRALHDYLAARSREPRESWVGRELARSARVTGVPEERLGQLEELLADLDRAVYAGGSSSVDRARIMKVVDGLKGAGL